MFQQMLQSGIAAQHENVRAMQQLFDAFWQERTDRPEAAPKETGRVRGGGRNP